MILLIPFVLIGGWFLFTWRRNIPVEQPPSYPMYYIVPVTTGQVEPEPSWWMSNFHWIAILFTALILFV